MATSQFLAVERAACGVLLFIRLFPHHSVVPMLFLNQSPSGSWRQALPRQSALKVGDRARIPGGKRVDVANRSALRLAP